MSAVRLGLGVTIVSALMAAGVPYRDGRDLGLMLKTQGTKTKLVAGSVVAERLKMFPPMSPISWLISASILATADQWSEEGNASQSHAHAGLEATEDIGQCHAVGDVGVVHLREADQADDTGDAGAGQGSDKSVSYSINVYSDGADIQKAQAEYGYQNQFLVYAQTQLIQRWQWQNNDHHISCQIDRPTDD